MYAVVVVIACAGKLGCNIMITALIGSCSYVKAMPHAQMDLISTLLPCLSTNAVNHSVILEMYYTIHTLVWNLKNK